MSTNENEKVYKRYGFSKAILLPSDDPEEFDRLHKALIREWMPEDPKEEDDVLSLANNLWRKRQLGRRRQSELVLLHKKAESALEGAWRDISLMSKFLEEFEADALGSFKEQDLSDRFGKTWARYFNKYVPRSMFKDDVSWLLALKESVGDRMLRVWSIERDVIYFEEKFTDWARVAEELEVEEQIDAANERIINRLKKAKKAKAAIYELSKPRSRISRTSVSTQRKFWPQR